jgi:hypothetical protein
MADQQNTDKECTTAPEQPLAPAPLQATINEKEQANLLADIAKGKENPTPDSKRQFGTLEILALVFDGLLVVIGVGALGIYNGQLSVMRGTLTEMQRSGGDSTQQVWRAIDNLNWMARTADQSSKATIEQMKAKVWKCGEVQTPPLLPVGHGLYR